MAPPACLRADATRHRPHRCLAGSGSRSVGRRLIRRRRRATTFALPLQTKVPSMNPEMLEKITSGQGFIAALDQSGGSTPRALRQYGVADDAWPTDEELFSLVNQMRTRIITSPTFGGERILGAILFEGTMDREIDGQPSAAYLWERKNVVPFVKVDKGLEDEQDGVQMMKPMPEL